MEFGKKKGMSAIEKKAKLDALKGTHKWASDELKGKLGDLKKVTAASDSKEGLKIIGEIAGIRSNKNKNLITPKDIYEVLSSQ